MLGALIWLVIAGVILGLDAADERVVLGGGRAGRRLARAASDRANSSRELLTRGFREMWLPAWYGLRLVRRSGMLPFATFALLFAYLYVGRTRPGLLYEVIGPHEVTWWIQALPVRRLRDGARLRDPARLPAGGGVQPRDGASQCAKRSEASGPLLP